MLECFPAKTKEPSGEDIGDMLLEQELCLLLQAGQLKHYPLDT